MFWLGIDRQNGYSQDSQNSVYTMKNIEIMGFETC